MKKTGLIGLLLLFCFSVFGQRIVRGGRTAAKPKKVVAHEELGNAAFNEYRFEEAVQHFEEFLKTPKLNDSITRLTKEKLSKAHIGQRMMRGVEDITIVDSMQINKKDLLKAYQLDKENGSLLPAGFMTGRENLKYVAEKNKDGNLDLFTSAKLAGEWSEPEPLSSRVNTPANENFPFVTADGITLYFASDNAETLGGYDVFMTRFQPGANDYLQPENMGMPFNSPFNDYLLVIDEVQGIGWFASDRRQPEGKAVVYTFIPNAFKKIVDTDSIGFLRTKASLRGVKMEKDKLPKEKTQNIGKQPAKKTPEFEFWVNDKTVYHFLPEFKSDVARKFFVQAQQAESKNEEQKRQLELLRADYEKAGARNKALIAGKITELEKSTAQNANRPADFYRQAQEVENKRISGR